MDRLMHETWPQLPPEMRKNSTNLATIRIGAVCFVLFVLGGMASMVAHDTPDRFITEFFSFQTFFAVIGMIGAIVILILRAMQVAPRFVEAYAQMLPDHADQIRVIYAERGLGDVVAPWVRRKGGRMSRIFGHYAKRFYIRQ